ncbi:MAG: HEAT repeat domain-containing protein [Candidatus Micrarchaeota archaeon]
MAFLAGSMEKMGGPKAGGMCESVRRFFRSLMPHSERPATDTEAEAFKRILFGGDRLKAVGMMRASPGRIEQASLLLSHPDYSIPACWTLGAAAREGIDIITAVPALEAGLMSEDKNMRCLSARALTLFAVNSGRGSVLLEALEPDDEFMRREAFDALGARATAGNGSAISLLAGLIGDERPKVRYAAAGVLYLVIETGPDGARQAVRDVLLSFREAPRGGRAQAL